jgi:parvulin-like peptidyl-prolyl isomerase
MVRLTSGSTMNRRSPYFMLLALSAHVAIAADQDIVARMGPVSLSEADVRLIARANPAEARSVLALEKRLRTEIIRRGVAAEARRQSFDKKPEVAARMEQAAEQALVTSYMNGIAQPPADYPSAELLQQTYDANKDALIAPRQYRVSQIYVAGADEKARKLADELAKAARRKNTDFAALARKSSQHAASAGKGGDLGWLSESELAPAFRQALLGLAKGEVGAPAAGPEGWHILKLVERKEPELQPLEKVRDALARNLRLRKAAEIEQAYLEAMLTRTPISVNGIALEGMVKR